VGTMTVDPCVHRETLTRFDWSIAVDPLEVGRFGHSTATAVAECQRPQGRQGSGPPDAESVAAIADAAGHVPPKCGDGAEVTGAFSSPVASGVVGDGAGGTLVVTGQLILDEGRPASNGVLPAYDQGLRGEQRVGACGPDSHERGPIRDPVFARGAQSGMAGRSAPDRPRVRNRRQGGGGAASGVRCAARGEGTCLGDGGRRRRLGASRQAGGRRSSGGEARPPDASASVGRHRIAPTTVVTGKLRRVVWK
jgi:hypothetical protein